MILSVLYNEKIFLNDRFILTIILINSLIIFITGFNIEPDIIKFLRGLDGFITILFVIELIVKIKHFGKLYFYSSWNILDFVLIVLSIPAFFTMFIESSNFDLSYLLVLRALRAFKAFRFIKFVTEINELIKGINRALKTSLVVLIGFSVYLFIMSIFSFYLFAETAPEYFENPLLSLYSIFKIFTVEGWYEIPESIVHSYNSVQTFFTYIYFIFIVMSGGIFGLSLVNSIFVDAMVSDNNDLLEKKIGKLESQINILIEKIDNNGVSS
ncbi:ion transporter [Carboxylicivirga caseinilyticus]|uniref:ion transporter n=1 Tax=Carboxylicivirga caseinilyticus TaxID=3417572 RepID=UPI003D32F73B|nr:ion transporter [Marinilabiliaceae bacterium A049]